jgi:hypothetical protein
MVGDLRLRLRGLHRRVGFARQWRDVAPRRRLAILLVLAGVLGTAARVFGQVPAPERPTYALGDTWALSDAVYELTRIEKDAYVFTAGSSRIVLSRDLAPGRVERQGLLVLDFDPPPRFTWPLEVGKVRRSSGVWRGPACPSGARTQFVWKVERPEEVRVAGGVFTAFRIDLQIQPEPCGNVNVLLGVPRLQLWYAPEARRLVKLQGQQLPAEVSFELSAGGGSGAAGTGAAGTGAATAPAVVRAPTVPPAPTPPRSDTAPPRIALSHPAGDGSVDRALLVLAGSVTDDTAVARVEISVNGVELPAARTITPARASQSINATVTLQPGENVIVITATDAAGNESLLARRITLAPAAPASAGGKPVMNYWAVVIGIGQYASARIPPLRYAARDADAVYQLLTTRGGYPRENVMLLTDATPEKPTLQNIRRALGEFLARKAGRDDMVLIYFAGHGAPEVDAAGVEADGLSKYLVPRDADPDALFSTAFPMEDVQRIFARIAAERVVLLLDTCYSGAAGGRTFARQGTRALGLNDQFLERLARSKGRVIVTASGPSEVALESAELGHGVFTYHLLQGLEGKADLNRDGVVTVSELYEYVEAQVERAARAAGGRQRPVMKGEVEGAIPLTRTAR